MAAVLEIDGDLRRSERAALLQLTALAMRAEAKEIARRLREAEAEDEN